MRFSATRLDSLLAAFARSKILVIGDLMLDEFLWGKVTRISPEAPVPILEVQRRAAYPGGAANVARSLASLGAQTALAGVIGDDETAGGVKLGTGTANACNWELLKGKTNRGEYCNNKLTL